MMSEKNSPVLGPQHEKKDWEIDFSNPAAEEIGDMVDSVRASDDIDLDSLL